MGIYVVTGASSGIGKIIYGYFQSLGKTIGISRRGPDLFYDLSDSNTYDKVLSDVGEDIQVWVNNAGIFRFEWEREEEILKQYQVNLLSTYHFCRKLKRMINPGGHIINIASISGFVASPDSAFYAATKAGVISLTKSFAKEYAEIPIYVNCISPGFFESNLVEGDVPWELVMGIPLKRVAKGEEIIPVIEYLLKSKYTTGSNIVIDGGDSL